MLNFKPNIIIRKINPQKFGKPQERSLAGNSFIGVPRKLMKQNPPPLLHHEMGVLPTSIPQITAPRLILRNFAKPTPVGYLEGYARRSEVSIDQKPHENKHSFATHPVILSRKLAVKRNYPASEKGRNRKLMVAPYLNVGTGHMDIGSHGYSQLSYALFHPETTTMGPFVPRRNPPPPIRIQIHEPFVESSKKMLVSTTEKELFNQEERQLEKELEFQFDSLNEEARLASEEIDEKLEQLEKNIKTKREQIDAMKIQKETFQDELKKQVEKKISEFKKIATDIKSARETIEKNYSLIKESHGISSNIDRIIL